MAYKKAPKIKRMSNGEYRMTMEQKIRFADSFETPKWFIATDAEHQFFGDISRPEGDLCQVTKEVDDNWIGCWVTGFGFFNVIFPKSTTRPLTDEEVEKYNNTYVQISDQYPIKLNVNND